MCNLAAAIDRYVSYLRNERNMAPRTVTAYNYDLRRFQDWITDARHGSVGIAAVNTYDLKDYLATLQEENGCKPATLCRVISSLR